MGVHQPAIECFDMDGLAVMRLALDAAVATVLLAGDEPGEEIKLEMARRILNAMKGTEVSKLELMEAALDGRWK